MRTGFLRVAFLVSSLFVAGIAIVCGTDSAHFAVQAQSAPNSAPMTLGGLIDALKKGISVLPASQFVQTIQRRGVSFEVTASAERQLQQAGATPAIIQAARANFRGTRAAVSPAPAPPALARAVPVTPAPAPAPAAATNSANTSHSIRYTVDGTGPEFILPKINGRTLDGCLIKPENPGGDGCSVQDTQNIAARFCELAHYQTSESYRVADTGRFQSSYKFTKRIASDGSWEYLLNEDDAGGYIITYIKCR